MTNTRRPSRRAVVQLEALAAELLDQAGDQSARRASRTVAAGTAQRVTVIALAEGARLADHDSPTAATLHVLTGRVRLHTDDREWFLDAGELLPVPPERHGVEALVDSAFLFTVALR
jgi:quercetin dioxygenase-like cupin family protein